MTSNGIYTHAGHVTSPTWRLTTLLAATGLGLSAIVLAGGPSIEPTGPIRATELTETRTGVIDPDSWFVLYSRNDGFNWLKDGNGDVPLLAGEQARLSPDGQYIAYRIGDIPTGDLYVRDLQSGSDTLVYNGYDYLDSFAWTPDGNRLVFDHSCGIYAIDPDGANLQQLVDDWPPGGNDCYNDGVDVNPVDGRLTWVQWDFGIAVSDPDGQNPYLVPNTDVPDAYPMWSPDGEWIAFFDWDELYKIRPDGSDLTRLTSLLAPSYVERTGAWTADGASILPVIYTGGTWHLYRVATDGSGMMTLLSLAPGDVPWYVGSVGMFTLFQDGFESGGTTFWSAAVP